MKDWIKNIEEKLDSMGAKLAKKEITIPTDLAAAIVFFIFSISVAYSINKSIGRCKTELSTVTYCVDTNLPVPLRIVHLSDLHSCLYGAENETLVHMVSVQAPDLILMTGDMMDRSDDAPEVVCQLIEALSEIAPIYYSYGNHEYAWMEETGTNLTAALSELKDVRRFSLIEYDSEDVM